MTRKGADHINVSQIMAKYKQWFDPNFQEYFDNLKQTFKYPASSSFVPQSIELLEELSMRGGKRQRVAFLYEAFKLFPSSVSDEALLSSAVSIELLQSHLLIHDDYIDQSPMRRGDLTTFFAYKDAFSDTPKEQQTAAGLTILLGDIAAYLAIDVLLRDTTLTPEQCRKLVAIQTQAGLDTFTGQIFDLERDLSDTLSEEDLTVLAEYKAAQSSTVAPLLMGTVFVPSLSGEMREHLIQYGLAVGVAGQIYDDILGLFGDSSVMGKSNISDIAEGKRTLLISKAFQYASKEEKQIIASALENPDVTSGEVEEVRAIIQKSGALDKTRDIAASYAERAKTEIGHLPASKHRDFFAGVSDWFINREL